MARFIEGADRRQAALLPEALDDYVDVDNPVRVVERPQSCGMERGSLQ